MLWELVTTYGTGRYGTGDYGTGHYGTAYFVIWGGRYGTFSFKPFILGWTLRHTVIHRPYGSIT